VVTALTHFLKFSCPLFQRIMIVKPRIDKDQVRYINFLESGKKHLTLFQIFYIMAVTGYDNTLHLRFKFCCVFLQSYGVAQRHKRGLPV
jgi:hypothetical protein